MIPKLEEFCLLCWYRSCCLGKRVCMQDYLPNLQGCYCENILDFVVSDALRSVLNNPVQI